MSYETESSVFESYMFSSFDYSLKFRLHVTLAHNKQHPTNESDSPSPRSSLPANATIF
jgi:hypothetical protein